MRPDLEYPVWIQYHPCSSLYSLTILTLLLNYPTPPHPIIVNFSCIIICSPLLLSSTRSRSRWGVFIKFQCVCAINNEFTLVEKIRSWYSVFLANPESNTYLINPSKDREHGKNNHLIGCARGWSVKAWVENVGISEWSWGKGQMKQWGWRDENTLMGDCSPMWPPDLICTHSDKC